MKEQQLMENQRLQEQISQLTETFANVENRFRNDLAQKDEQIDSLTQTISAIESRFQHDLAAKEQQIRDLNETISNNQQHFQQELTLKEGQISRLEQQFTEQVNGLREQTRQQMELAQEQQNKMEKIVEKSDLLMEMLESYALKREAEMRAKLTLTKPGGLFSKENQVDMNSQVSEFVNLNNFFLIVKVMGISSFIIPFV